MMGTSLPDVQGVDLVGADGVEQHSRLLFFPQFRGAAQHRQFPIAPSAPRNLVAYVT
jgi:hypothetical protein